MIARTLLAGIFVGGLPLAAAVDFEKDIWPIFEDRCVDCHRAPYVENGRKKEPKAGLRLDGAGWILHGSKDGPILKAGDARLSALYQLISLPPDDDDIMPPKGDPLTESQIERIRDWINEGAQFGAWKGDEEGVPTEDRSVLVLPSAAEIMYKALEKDIPVAEDAAVLHAREFGFYVAAISTNSPLLQVANIDLGPDMTDVHLRELARMKAQITDLDLGGAGVTDAGLEDLAAFTNLTRLNLSRTRITDAGTRHLARLDKLRYLNLYGTDISDAGLTRLAALKHLDALYLWGSQVSEKGVQRLRKALPDARIHF